MPAKLSAAERDAALAKLTDWTLAEDGEAIRRTLKFDDFKAAFAFMTRVALAAEKADHHPDWSNSYDTVEITLSTHDAGGLTGNDIALAEAIDDFAG